MRARFHRVQPVPDAKLVEIQFLCIKEHLERNLLLLPRHRHRLLSRLKQKCPGQK